MFITISGPASSGKGTVARILAERLGYRYVSMGQIMRGIAQKRGISLEGLNKLCEDDPSIDTEVDDYQITLGKGDGRMVVDSRLGWHFIPHSVKVYLDCDLDERARRVFEAQRVDEKFESVDEARDKLLIRHRSDSKRYQKYYNVDCFDTDNYDLVLDSTDLTPDAIVVEIMEFVRSR